MAGRAVADWLSHQCLRHRRRGFRSGFAAAGCVRAWRREWKETARATFHFLDPIHRLEAHMSAIPVQPVARRAASAPWERARADLRALALL